MWNYTCSLIFSSIALFFNIWSLSLYNLFLLLLTTLNLDFGKVGSNLLMAAEKALSWRVSTCKWKKCQINKGSNEPHKKVLPFVYKIDRKMPTYKTMIIEPGWEGGRRRRWLAGKWGRRRRWLGRTVAARVAQPLTVGPPCYCWKGGAAGWGPWCCCCLVVERGWRLGFRGKGKNGFQRGASFLSAPWSCGLFQP